MSVEQVVQAIERNDTIAARQDVVVAAYDQLWRRTREALVELVRLKDLKEAGGETGWTAEEKVAAWDVARSVVRGAP